MYRDPGIPRDQRCRRTTRQSGTANSAKDFQKEGLRRKSLWSKHLREKKKKKHNINKRDEKEIEEKKRKKRTKKEYLRKKDEKDGYATKATVGNQRGCDQETTWDQLRNCSL